MHVIYYTIHKSKRFGSIFDFTREEMDLKQGWFFPPIIPKAILSEVISCTPLYCIRWRATLRSTAERLLTASTHTKTLYPSATRSMHVCITQIWVYTIKLSLTKTHLQSDQNNILHIWKWRMHILFHLLRKHRIIKLCIHRIGLLVIAGSNIRLQFIH